MIFIKHADALDGRIAIVDIEGPLDGKTSPDLEDYINRLLEKEKYFILLNAQKLEYVSSEGIGLVLFIEKKISERNGAFIIFNLPAEIRSFYSLLGFDKIFHIAESRIEAMQIMDRHMELRDKPCAPDHGGTAAPFRDTPRHEVTDSESEARQASPAAGSEGGFPPFIVECSGCGALVRVKHSGDYLCPDCNREFSVSDNRTVSFYA
jgi:anti-anti-sigma factor